jgi:predicted site-specific integrase-resolvase
MPTESPVPAAQYLRVSTDHQQYSLDNQADAIARYADERGFTITRTYTDATKSGLRIKNRDGLKQLLKDVVEGNRDYRAHRSRTFALALLSGRGRNQERHFSVYSRSCLCTYPLF